MIWVTVLMVGTKTRATFRLVASKRDKWPKTSPTKLGSAFKANDRASKLVLDWMSAQTSPPYLEAYDGRDTAANADDQPRYQGIAELGPQ